jgi:hypothetical protein
MMTAYMDESGHESSSTRMFLAGWLGNEDQWKDFAPKWKKALGAQRPSLHMTELRWNQERTHHLLQRLGPIPRSCGLIPVLGGIKYADYADMIKGTTNERMFKAYLVCVFAVTVQMLRVIPDSERLEIVFEVQKEYENFAHQALSDISTMDFDWNVTKGGLPKLAKWSFVPKGSTILTDPSDYFAFALRELWADKASRKTLWCASMLTSAINHAIGSILSREKIRDIMNDIRLVDERMRAS